MPKWIPPKTTPTPPTPPPPPPSERERLRARIVEIESEVERLTISMVRLWVRLNDMKKEG